MRKAWWLSLLLLIVLLGSLAWGSYAVLTFEPAFYQQVLQAEGPQRQSASREFEQRVVTLANDITYSRNWKFSCSTEQINSYLVEDFLKTEVARILPNRVHDLRVQFLQDEMKLGFRYGEGHLKTIVSMQLKAWLAQREPNTIIIEILSLQAGAMPFGIKAFHEEIAEQLRSQNIKVLWYRKDGHPTVVLKFQADRREPSFHFKQLEIQHGQFFIEGETLDPEAPK
ncbi:MAG TPA: hypothetical protein PKA06_15240 [Gemmatales bacterium]|nr:hypothetical protein [Gemmatales bacterium]HMP15458.1 hypothetical protein [Gemmatales bacterium]